MKDQWNQPVKGDFGRSPDSAYDFLDQVTVHVGQTPVDRVMTDSQALVVQSELVKHRRIDVVDLGRVLAVEWLVTPLITLPVGNPALETAPGQPIGEDEGIVIPPLACLATGHPTELGGPMNDRILK